MVCRMQPGLRRLWRCSHFQRVEIQHCADEQNALISPSLNDLVRGFTYHQWNFIALWDRNDIQSLHLGIPDKNLIAREISNFYWNRMGNLLNINSTIRTRTPGDMKFWTWNSTRADANGNCMFGNDKIAIYGGSVGSYLL